MDLRDRTPRLEIHIRDMSTGWEICPAWQAPPSACVQAQLRKHEVNSMTVDIKPRNSTAYTKSAPHDWLQDHSKSRTLLRENMFSADVQPGYCFPEPLPQHLPRRTLSRQPAFQASYARNAGEHSDFHVPLRVIFHLMLPRGRRYSTRRMIPSS